MHVARDVDRSTMLLRAKQAAEAMSVTSGGMRPRRLPWGVFGDSLHLSEYGLPSGLIFLLRSMLEASLAFSLIYALQHPLWQDNVARNEVRSSCFLRRSRRVVRVHRPSDFARCRSC